MAQLSEAAFVRYLDDVRLKIESVAPIARSKEINYGYQFVLESTARKLTINIYNGKKGLNIVYTGDDALKEQAAVLLSGGVKPKMQKKPVMDDIGKSTILNSSTQIIEHHEQWAGSDESGKGDFFGPLVVAAVVVDSSTAGKLTAAGVKDCKLLTDNKILQLEDTIKANVVDFSVLTMVPKVYNMRYEQIVSAGGKLNQLLGLGHIAALSQVLAKHVNCTSALIDQFTPSYENVRELHKRFPHCHVRQQPKAESDIAVAAASVLARASFLRTMEELATRAGVSALPKGGGTGATTVARELAKKLGKEALREYVKIHFVNYTRI